MTNGLHEDGLSFKVCICGYPGVGKTALLHRRVTASFEENYRPTVGAAFATVMESIDDFHLNLSIWDTAGQEKYQSMMPLYFRGVACILLVVDVTNPASWEFAKRWVDSELGAIAPRPIVFIVGNKIDLDPHLKFSTELIEWAQQMRLPRVLTSAVSGSGVDELFLTMARALLEWKLDRRPPVEEAFTKPSDPEEKCC